MSTSHDWATGNFANLRFCMYLVKHNSTYKGVRQHAKRANAHSSTFGFCRHAKPKQKTKRA
jgi:hypothetical protein